ncbi:unnamed protein product, partial [Iphiclides podalirius]
MPRARRVLCGVLLSASTGALAGAPPAALAGAPPAAMAGAPPAAPALLLLRPAAPPPRPSCSFHLLPESQRLLFAHTLPPVGRACCEADAREGSSPDSGSDSGSDSSAESGPEPEREPSDWAQWRAPPPRPEPSD